MKDTAINEPSKDIWADYGFDDENFGLLDWEEEDKEYGLEAPHQGPPPPEAAIEQERSRLAQLLENPDLSSASRHQLSRLQGKLNHAVALSGDGQDAALAEIDGLLNSLEHPGSGTQLPLDERIQAFLEEQPSLEEDQRQKLEKWIGAYQLDPDGSGPKIEEEFAKIQETASDTAV